MSPFRSRFKRGQVEHVLEALAVRLEDDRERAVAPGDLEQALRLQALLPERRPLAGAAPRDEQRAGRVLAEARAEERRRAELAHDEVLDLGRVDDQLLGRRRGVRLREMDRDPVVRPERLRLEPERVAEPDPDRHRPGCVHARPERRQHAHPPVADLVAEALDDDRPVRRHRPGRLLLVAQEREQVPGRLLVERVLLGQALERLLLGESDELTRRTSDRFAELVRTAGAFALPERDQPGHARSRRDEHPVARDLLDPPRRRAERERLPRAGLVDHLLVQLADAAAAVDQMHAVQAAIRDRARVLDRELPPAAPPADHPARAIPDDPRPELRELVGRVAPGEHVEHVLELDAREVGEVVGAANEVVQLVDRDLLVRADRDDLLCEHVERVARDDGLLDRAGLHALDDDRGFEQVGPELREDSSARDGAKLVAGAPDALQAACDRLRRLDLDDEVDRAHVDAELE